MPVNNNSDKGTSRQTAKSRHDRCRQKETALFPEESGARARGALAEGENDGTADE